MWCGRPPLRRITPGGPAQRQRVVRVLAGQVPHRVCPACRKADVARANLGEHLVLCTTKRTGAQPKPIGASSPSSPFTAGFVFSGPRLCLPRFGPCSPKSKPSGAKFSTQPIANAIIKENTRPSGGSLTVGTAPNSWYASYPSLRASPAVRCKRKLYDFRTEAWTTLSGLP